MAYHISNVCHVQIYENSSLELSFYWEEISIYWIITKCVVCLSSLAETNWKPVCLTNILFRIQKVNVLNDLEHLHTERYFSTYTWLAYILHKKMLLVRSILFLIDQLKIRVVVCLLWPTSSDKLFSSCFDISRKTNLLNCHKSVEDE